jgi:hypothetical protein
MDYYWPTETYCFVMKRAGFKEVTSCTPRLDPHTIKEMKLLQGKGVFPCVDYQAFADGTPTVIIKGKRQNHHRFLASNLYSVAYNSSSGLKGVCLPEIATAS